MLIKFYSPDFELSPSFCQEVEKSLEKVVKRAPFLLGQKKRRQEAMRAKMTVEKDEKYSHKIGKRLEEGEEGGKFKLSLKLTFSGQQIFADGRGDDLYLLLDAVQEKLAREVRRYRGKHRDWEEKGARRWKRLLRFPLIKKDFQKKTSGR